MSLNVTNNTCLSHVVFAVEEAAVEEAAGEEGAEAEEGGMGIGAILGIAVGAVVLVGGVAGGGMLGCTHLSGVWVCMCVCICICL